MSALASLSSLLKRPAVWLGGLLTAAVAAFVTTNLLTPVQTFLAEKTAEKACQYRQKPITNDSQFIVLVSPLVHDPDGSQTELVKSAFHGENGFVVVPICDPVGFDYSKDIQTAENETVQHAWELIKSKHADLLLFGEVRERDKAVKIWAVNEHGGCDRHPKPTIIERGDITGDFTAEEKEKLIEVSLEQIQSACINQSSINWPLFAKRMAKMEMFLNNFDFSQPKTLYFADSYIDAMRLLYANGQGEIWFSKGEEFAKGVINRNQDEAIGKDKVAHKELSNVYEPYAALLSSRFDKTKDKNDLDAAFSIFDKAITLDPNDSAAYYNRGYAYEKKGDWDRAIEDYTKAIGVNPTYTSAYERRGEAFNNKGEWDLAIADFTKAVDLDPEYGRTYCYCHRGVAYAKKGNWDRAIEDFTKAIDFDPKHAGTYTARGKRATGTARSRITPKALISIQNMLVPIPPEAMLMRKKAIGIERSEITTKALTSIARRSNLIPKALICGLVAVGRVQ